MHLVRDVHATSEGRASNQTPTQGPPLLPLRLMAPVLVASTLAVLASGVLLLAAGHKSSTLLTIHKLSFIVCAVLLAVHFLAYVPRVMRSLRADWTTARRRAVPGAGARAMLVAAAAGGGAALALALLPTIHAYAGHWQSRAWVSAAQGSRSSHGPLIRAREPAHRDEARPD